MESLLQELAHQVSLAVELVAIAAIALGAIEAVIRVAPVGYRADEAAVRQQRAIWLKFARWLVAGLTFQLAADLVGTSFAPTWDEVGHLAVIAVIRTFLSYFLDKEMESMRETQERQERDHALRA